MNRPGRRAPTACAPATSSAMAVRGETRLALDEPVRLAPNAWSSVEVRMLECSAKDFRAKAELNLRAGARVALDLPGLGRVTALVAWQGADQFFAIFDEPIDLARAGFLSVNKEAVLARLLTERAAAHVNGKRAKERELRGRILDGLPIRRAAG